MLQLFFLWNWCYYYFFWNSKRHFFTFPQRVNLEANITKMNKKPQKIRKLKMSNLMIHRKQKWTNPKKQEDLGPVIPYKRRMLWSTNCSCNEMQFDINKEEKANLRGEIISNSIGANAWQKHQRMIPRRRLRGRKIPPQSHPPFRFLYFHVVKLVSCTDIWLLLLIILFFYIISIISLQCSFGQGQPGSATKWRWEFGCWGSAGRSKGII